MPQLSNFFRRFYAWIGIETLLSIKLNRNLLLIEHSSYEQQTRHAMSLLKACYKGQRIF